MPTYIAKNKHAKTYDLWLNPEREDSVFGESRYPHLVVFFRNGKGVTGKESVGFNTIEGWLNNPNFGK